MNNLATCHQCKVKGNARVGIAKDGYIVRCKCGNEGINVIKTIVGAIASWCSGHQKSDKEKK